MKSSFFIIANAIASLLLMPTASHGQNFRGSLIGTVVDSSGGRIPAADTPLQASESSQERRIRGGGSGEFKVSDLLPGV